MPREREVQGVPLTAIHINLQDRSIEFENEHGTVARLLFAREGILFDAGPVTIGDTDGEEIPETDSALSEVLPATEDRESRQRLTLSGRVGLAPTFRTTPKGKLIARFPLAVHEENKTTWHKVLAFGDRAERLRETLHKGDPVTVIGYQHEREAKLRDGTVRKVQELYAVVVKQR